MIKSKNAGKKQNNQEEEGARNNLLGFFSLLLKIGMRVNPQRYKLKKIC
jgi:hypothetical protein